MDYYRESLVKNVTNLNNLLSNCIYNTSIIERDENKVNDYLRTKIDSLYIQLLIAKKIVNDYDKEVNDMDRDSEARPLKRRFSETGYDSTLSFYQ